MIDKIWDKMMQVRADKFWHFIAFREFTALLLKTGIPIGFIISITLILGIGKEFYDWHKGQYFDFGDLFADFLGVICGIINQ
jgi:hypothetical protein